MCGIAGIVAVDRLSPMERAALPGMRDLLAHRGPDDAGEYIDDFAALGHRRLSILDHATGHQPIANEDGSIIVVFNGEIYGFRALRESLIGRGHQFATAGDAEVIVHAYEEFGDECWSHLDGMFAIAIWDAPRRRLLLARDRLGVKPLYYCVDGRRLIFGSELKAVIAAPDVMRAIEPTALMDYLALGFIPSPGTIYSGVCKLQPGECLRFEAGRVEIRRYWEIPFPAGSPTSPDALRDELWSRLRTATRSRLIADVPIGAFLSGGVDSAAVVALMTDELRGKCEGAVETCTIGFDDSQHDERHHARTVAQRVGSVHHERLVRADAVDLIGTLAWHFDEPFADSSAIPCFLLAEAARRHFTVALSGDGGDEVLAGYRRYRFDVNEQRVRQSIPTWLRHGLIGPVAGLCPNPAWLPRVLRARTTLANLASDPATAHARSITRLEGTAARKLLHPDIRAAVRDYDPFDHVRTLYRNCVAVHHLDKCQYVDIRLGLGDGILTKVDRASMAHGLEVRSPMLDYRFVEFAFSIPPAQRIYRGRGKHLLREAVGRRLGPEVAARAKRGFAVPLDAWFRNVGLSEDLIPCSTESSLLDPVAVGRLREQHRRGARNHGAVLWAVAMLDAWHRRIHEQETSTPSQGSKTATARKLSSVGAAS